MFINGKWVVNFDEMLRFAPPTDEGGEGESDEDSADVREASLQRMLDRNKSDLTGLVRDLHRDNFKLRESKRTLTAENKELQGKIPPEGSKVLTPDESAQWAAYQALGTPDKVKESIENVGQLQGKLDSMAREKTIRDAASVAGFHGDVLLNADALAEREGKTLSYLIKQVDVDGKKVDEAFVKDGDAEKSLMEYAQENWALLMPSLTVQESGGSSRSQSQGVVFPSQHQGAGGGSRSSTPNQQTKAVIEKSYPRPAKTS